ncbi:Zn-dependent protease [Photobacterium jeanii]|uniref:Zn-dependent protease n=1 Tax=Photobacterium jeanii TaxID=858640 RepID=A0A178K2T6_9GAMM|nr:TldD/PmbA family protein [Photobacterium jeanii]OAN11044.1 Zn-dependent protease [Photobacterium jeanii]PST90557.1 TldD/PmbA family protein [Photobacterium jeanii]
MADSNKLHNAINHVLERVEAANAQADVIANRSNNFSLKANAGELDEYKVTSGQVIGVRVVKEGHVATSYSESLEPTSLDAMVEQALTNAKFTQADEHQTISCVDSKLTTEVAEIYQQDDATVDDKIALALALESGVVAKPHAKSAPYNGFGESDSQVILANTQGTLCQHQERSTYCYAYSLIEKDGLQAMHGGMSSGRRFEQLDPEFCINHGYETAFALLEGKPIATNSYSVMFELSCLSSLFGAFGMCLSGQAAMKGINPWREALHTQVASPLLTVSDIAMIEGGSAIKAFDSEGYATKDTILIGEGELQSLLHNSHTASFFGIENTANASRSAKGGLGVSSRHTVIATGTSSEAEVTAGEYLELVELQGVHSGADAVSGDFSFGASGFLCRDGKRVQPVRGITVAGNFYQMLKEIDAVGNQLQNDYERDFFAPQIRFARLNIAGS